MTFQDSFPLSDPRLNNKIAHYDRNEVIADLLSFYNFLFHISASQIATAPSDGWLEITVSSFAVHGIYKTLEALELLRYLPYISCDQPWIMITAIVAEKQWPAWVVQLTSGTNREGHRYMLDRTDGTITMHCTGGYFEYSLTYEPDDSRDWRDRECYPETVTLKDWLEKWREEYRQTTTLAVPEDSIYDGYGSWDPFFGGLEDKPDSYNFEEMDGLRKIYREYGWPDREKYRKQACIQAIQHWYRGFMEGKREERRIELLEFWKQRGIAPPEESNTQDMGK
ncbi:hypothetical protein BDZ45DRAFT_725041 [Acephala macrosclerotiorum]|nr:hypothetical protein BDZ45DRAFT_725041 [Acephala macrosclerotiorum]